MVKKIKVLITTLVLLFVSIKPSMSADTGWVIDNFDSNITISPNTSVDVIETIDVDFRNLAKHGIYREIPVDYNDKFGQKLNIRYKTISVEDINGKGYKFTESKSGNDVVLKIGDVNETITGKNTYIVHYLVERVITTPNDLAELYWNVTGNSWPVTILKASASVNAPELNITDTNCFTGYFGEQGKECRISGDTNASQFSAKLIQPGEGLTIAVVLDPNGFIWPNNWDKLKWFLNDNRDYAKPILVFVFMLILYMRRGRDKRFKNMFHDQGEVESVPLFTRINALTTFEPPKNLSPGEVGVLVDERAQLRDITAVVIDLARRGYFKIIEKKPKSGKTEFEFINAQKDEAELKGFEKSALDMLFGKKRKKSTFLSSMPKKAYQYIEDVKENLFKDVTENGYFEGNPKKVRIKYLILGLIIIFFAPPIMLMLGGGSNFYTSSIIATTLSGLIVIVFGLIMPARTAKGRKALVEIAGLREFIKTGAWRQKIYEKYNFFEEVLPFTIAFGLTSKFIKAFKASEIKSPDWYQPVGIFNPTLFATSMGRIDSGLGTGIAATRPKSSASSGGSGFGGGGFSGGGFGGGGGGSW